jgi:hypothetical protein
MICHPEELSSAQIVTAGAYVMFDDAFLFAIGPSDAEPGLAVFRIGGRLEAGETVWFCAAREAAEEAAIQIEPLMPPTTYWVGGGDIQAMRQVVWQPPDGSPVAPILVASRPAAMGGQLSVMYLAHATERPAPSAEVRGLLLIRPPEIHQIAQGSRTLGAFLRDGGDAILREPMDEERVLVPHLQLCALSEILKRHHNRLVK